MKEKERVKEMNDLIQMEITEEAKREKELEVK